MDRIEVVVKHLCQLAEGPLWDAKRGAICWVDILNGEIHQYITSKNVLETIPVNDLIGAVAICQSGDLLVALKSGLGMLSHDGGRIEMIVNPEAHLPENRYNDGKCDPE